MMFSDSPEQTLQLWGIPVSGELYVPTYTFNSAPSGAVDVDATFEYDLSVDLSTAPSEITGVAFRPVDRTFGTMPPKIGVVKDATFSCD